MKYINKRRISVKISAKDQDGEAVDGAVAKGWGEWGTYRGFTRTGCSPPVCWPVPVACRGVEVVPAVVAGCVTGSSTVLSLTRVRPAPAPAPSHIRTLL